MPIEKFNPQTLMKPRGFAHAVTARGGTTVYLSGQLSEDVEGNLIGAGDYAIQAEHAMLNLNRALEAAGASASDLVQMTILVVDHNEDNQALAFKGFAAASRQIGFRPVASLLIGCSSLASPGALVEVAGIAVVDAD
jgi:enamine deaminase RidA (YjgF/YER057c/UK114 family)